MAMENENIAIKTTIGLSSEDIDRLLTDRSVKAQIDLVQKLIDQYAAEGESAFTPQQTAIANDIFTLLLARGDVVVRAMLAMNLSQVDKLPPDLARQMARDVSNEVASYALQYSNVLSDDELTDIIASLVDTQKLQAIARREVVSEMLSDVLVGTSQETVVSTLLRNEGANIAEETFENIAQNHNNDSEVMESIFQRHSVPIAVVEKVIGHLSETMRNSLENKYGNLEEIVTKRKSLDRSLEQVRLKLMELKSSDQELMQLLHQLHKTGKLSPFSALCLANLELFEGTLSRLLHVPPRNVRILLQDATGFKAAYNRSGLPASMFEATVLAVRAIRLVEQESLHKTGRREVSSISQVLERMRQLSTVQKTEGADRLSAMMEHCQQ